MQRPMLATRQLRMLATHGWPMHTHARSYGDSLSPALVHHRLAVEQSVLFELSLEKIHRLFVHSFDSGSCKRVAQCGRAQHRQRGAVIKRVLSRPSVSKKRRLHCFFLLTHNDAFQFDAVSSLRVSSALGHTLNDTQQRAQKDGDEGCSRHKRR
jgi:hypothetical protein